MVRLLTLATVALASIQLGQATDLGEVDPKTVDEHKKGSLVVEYFMPDCKRCNDFTPKWNQIIKEYHEGDSTNIDFARVNCAVYINYCKENGMMRLPTIQARLDQAEWREYDGDYSLETVKQFIDAGNGYPRVERNANGKSVELSTSEELRQIIASKEPWFVKFYAPWCGHCKNLAPIWERMAGMLKGKVNIAEVNCDEQRALCSEYRVTGLPTLSFFVHGANLKYNGARKLKDLVDYALELSGSPVRPVDSDDKLTEVLRENDAALVYVRDSDDTHIDSFLENTIAPQFMETVPFYTTHNEETIKRFELTRSDLPAAVLVKDGTFFVYNNHNQRGFEAMVPWLQREQYPLVTRVLPHNSNEILRFNNQIVVLGITRPDGQDADADDKLRKMAQLYKERHASSNNDSKQPIMFAQLDGLLWRDYLSRVYGIQSHHLPALLVLNPKDQLYYNQHANEERFNLSKDSPERILESVQALDTLKGTSTAPSKAIMTLDKVLIYFGDHWVLMTTVLVGFLGLFFYLITKEDYDSAATAAPASTKPTTTSSQPTNINTIAQRKDQNKAE